MNEQAKMNQHQQQQQMMNLNQNMMSMGQLNPQQMVSMNRGYGMWAPAPAPPPQFQNPKPPPSSSALSKSLGPRSNWKGKKVNKANDKRRNEQQKSLMAGGIANGLGNVTFNNYQPPTLNELQNQNRLKTRKFFPKKKFNKNNSMNLNLGAHSNNSRSAPFAPRNTTSFIIRAKKSGGIASLVSPSPMTPAVLPTPILSPSREVLVDMAKEEWGVDGYGSMKGLIRLRSPGHEMEAHEDEEDDDGGSSGSDVEEHVEVERRLDHDLSRFEMIYDPNSINNGGLEYHNVLENRVDDQDTHIAQLEEENLILKERLFLMEREFEDLRRRMLSLERRENRGAEINEEVLENDSENESECPGEETHSMEDNNEDSNEYNNVQGDRCSKGKGDDDQYFKGSEADGPAGTDAVIGFEKKLGSNVEELAEANKNVNIADTKITENNNDINADKAEDNHDDVNGRQENNYDENKCLYVDVKAADSIGIESSDLVVAGDVCMEKVGDAKDSTVLPRDVAN